MRSSSALSFIALLLISQTPLCTLHGVQLTHPNFVIILADDLGYGDIGCYGRTNIATPHLNALAADGLRFTDFHSSGAVCSPTRAGLLTGRYQQRAGIPSVINADPQANRHHGLHVEEFTFAEGLRSAGYATAITGKWHLGYDRQFNPTHHGFDLFRGYVSGNVDYHSHVDRMGFLDWWNGLELADEPGYTTHLITQHAVEFIESHAKQPFCLYVTYESPHDPYQGPLDPPIRVAGQVVKNRYAPGQVSRAYREMIEEMDTGIGHIITTLKQLSLHERTLVFFFSDNGGTRHGDNGPFRGFKGGLYEGGHRVPAIAWWPGHIAPGSETTATGISLDVMPTLLDLANTTPPTGHRLDGVSLKPLLLQQESPQPRTLFWDIGNVQAMREGPWKLLLKSGHRGNTEPALFHLQKDLGELHNLAAEQPRRVARMTAAIRAWQTDVNQQATLQPAREVPTTPFP